MIFNGFANFPIWAGCGVDGLVFLFLACSDMISQGGLAIFIYGGVRMKGQIHTPKYGFTVNFAPKNIFCAYLLPKNIGDNFILVMNLIARNYF